MSKLLSELDFENAAKEIGCEVAAIKAVSEVEAPRGGFLPSGKPTILFEAHIFSARTGHKYDASHPNISSKKWNKSLYKGGEKEYNRLEQAKALNEIAALESTSWGKFQIMGFNYSICGWPDVKSFVNDMYISEGKHLTAFVRFIKYNKLDQYLISKKWAMFALGYNGKEYKQNKYDEKIAAAYKKYASQNPVIVDTVEEPIKPVEPVEPVEPTPLVKPEVTKSKSIFELILDIILGIFKK